MSSIFIFFFTGCLKITQTLKVADVRIKSFRNNSLVTDNSLYRLSSRKSQTFFKSALIRLFEVSTTVPSFEISQFYLNFSHEIHDVSIVNQSKPYDQMHPVTRSSK